MKLDKPSLPISLSNEDALAQINETIMEKNWLEEEIEISKLSLLYVPFFVFNYGLSARIDFFPPYPYFKELSLKIQP